MQSVPRVQSLIFRIITQSFTNPQLENKNSRSPKESKPLVAYFET